MKEGKTAHKNKAEQDIKCQKAWQKYNKDPKNAVTKLESSRFAMTKAKSRAVTPEEKIGKVSRKDDDKMISQR